MNKGFTLVETLVSLSLLMLAVLSSSRIMVAALAQTRQAQARFRLVEKLDYYKNYLSSLPPGAAELAPGPHSGQDGEIRAQWRVEDAGAFLKRVRLEVANAHLSLRLALCRSQFLREVRP
jgi:type II secretory pathway component PulJ